MLWTYLGDALWVIALSIMFSFSRAAWRRIPAGVKPPLMGQPLPRSLVVWALPGAAFALSLWFAMQARVWREDADLAFILFGVRAVSASLAALLHLRWLGAALTALQARGELKP